MGFEDIGPLPDSDVQPQDVPTGQSLAKDDEDTQPRRLSQVTDSNSSPIEPSYREHCSRSTSVPSQASSVYPPYLSYQPDPQQQVPGPFYPDGQPHQLSMASQSWQPPAASYSFAGYPPSYNYGYVQVARPVYPEYTGSWSPYSPYPYPVVLQPSQPRRDTYQFIISIISTIFSVLVILVGICCSFILLLLGATSSTFLHMGPKARFSATVICTVLTIVGLVGGSSSLYQSIRALSQKQSAPFKLPWSWLFLIFYILLLAIGFTVGSVPQVIAYEPMKIFFIVLASILPALTFLALAVRRVHYPQQAPWATTWRRFTLAIVSGGTVTVLLALIFEVALTRVAGNAFGINTESMDNLNMSIPRNAQQLLFLLILVAVIVPIIEECVKPLAVELMIGRLGSAAEAFTLGFACGIGFDLIETSGYISLSDSRPWTNIALERSTAGLLHGFGAGMVALGCYYLAHRNSINHRILIGLGCIAYAIVQHAIWNAAFLSALLPAPIGPFLEKGTISVGSYVMQGVVLVYIVESLLMFVFLLFVTARLRSQQVPNAISKGNYAGA